MRISDWSSDVCSSDLRWPLRTPFGGRAGQAKFPCQPRVMRCEVCRARCEPRLPVMIASKHKQYACHSSDLGYFPRPEYSRLAAGQAAKRSFHRPAAGAASKRRSEEHTSELQSLMRNSYAVFCLKKKNT